MNQLIAKIYHIMNRDLDVQDQHDSADNPITTAAVPGPEEPKQLHKGKRRIKENYTSHWDLDYLPRKEVEKIWADAEQLDTD